MADSPGDRLYLIRLACGDGIRKAEPLPEFAARVMKVSGAKYDPSTISLLERMKQKWKLEDVDHFAAADPLERGRAWLASLDSDENALDGPDPTKDRKLTMQEIQRARRQLEREQAERKSQTAAPPRKRRQGGAS